MHCGLQCTCGLTHAGNIVTANKLQAFYPPQAFQAVVQRLASVDFRCRLQFAATLFTVATQRDAICIVLMPSHMDIPVYLQVVSLTRAS